MLNYINAELYRYTHKRGTYVFYAVIIICIVGLFLLSNVTASNAPSESFIQFGLFLIPLIQVFIGTHVYLTVYNDDLSTKSMTNIISTGLAKFLVPIAKIIVSMITVLIGFIIMALLYFGIYFAIFHGFSELTAANIESLLSISFVVYLATIGVISITSIITYTFQKGGLGGVFIVALSTGLIAQILSLVELVNSNFRVIVDNTLTRHLDLAVSAIASGDSVNSSYYIAAFLYIVISLVIATFIFQKRDIEVG
ncbi:hypothetical protein LJB88_04475 [Erysipelotrichaceae bacterium OttesenSCG-928-M19]|nr:hypothetical protein [Erysipelotrichaceae bacterium OttesenSCG-928-M19]